MDPLSPCAFMLRSILTVLSSSGSMGVKGSPARRSWGVYDTHSGLDFAPPHAVS